MSSPPAAGEGASPAEHALAAVGARHAQARADLKAAIVTALAAGVSEVAAARLAGVNRSTVRRWTGKDTPPTRAGPPPHGSP